MLKAPDICAADRKGVIYVDGGDASYKGTTVAGEAYFQNAAKGRISVGTPQASRKTGAISFMPDSAFPR